VVTQLEKSIEMFLAAFQQGQESIPGNSCGANQVGDDVQADFIISGDDQGPGSAGLFQFYMATLWPALR